MKIYFNIIILLIVFFTPTFFSSVKAQEKSNSTETYLEKDLKIWIPKNGNLETYKDDKTDVFLYLNEYRTKLKPINWSYKYSILQKSNDKTSAFQYPIVAGYEPALFKMKIYLLTTYKNSKRKIISEMQTDEKINDELIVYEGKTIGFMRYDDTDKKIFLFIGNLNKTDIHSYLGLKKLDMETDYFGALQKFDDSINPIKVIDGLKYCNNAVGEIENVATGNENLAGKRIFANGKYVAYTKSYEFSMCNLLSVIIAHSIL